MPMHKRKKMSKGGSLRKMSKGGSLRKKSKKRNILKKKKKEAMPYLISNIPHFKCWVRREFTKNHEEYQDEYIHALAIAVTTIPVSYTHLRAHETV